MALRIWLPLNGSLENKGISDITVTNNGATVDNNGKIGKTYLFNGNYIKTEYTDYPTIFSNDFSICLWVYSTTDKTRDIYFANYGLSGGGNWFNLERDANNYLRFWWANGSPDYHNNNFVINQNEWTHITVTKSGNILTEYKNGVLVNTYSTTLNNAIPSTATVFYLGADYRTGQSIDLYGKLNDVRIYDHCLSPLEVKEISQGLILHYKLDNCVNDGNDNLLLRTKMDATAQAEFTDGGSTDFTKLFRYYNGNAGLHTFSETDGGGFEDTITLSTTGNLGIAFVRANSELNLDPNSYYTLSCEAKCTSASKKLAIGTSYRTTNNAWIWRGGSNAQSFTNVDTWQTFQYTFKPDSDILYICYCFTVSGSANGTDTFTIRHCKLEKGSIATEWSPAPEEGIIFNKIVDSSGYGNDGILSEYKKLYLSFDSKRYNKSIYLPKEKYAINTGFYFPMLIERVDIPECTLCLWVKPKNDFPGYGLTVYDGYFRIWLGGDDETLNLTMYDTTITLSTSKLHITLNEWNFISLVYKNKTAYGYINGEYADNFALPDYEHIYPTQRAGEYHNLGFYFTGNMNDVRLYHTALSAEDIVTLYHTPMQVDNLGGLHGFEFVEDEGNSVSKNGLIHNGNISQYEELSYLKYDSNLYFEPDGTAWVHIYHHNHPDLASFTSTDTFATSVKKDDNRWFNATEICNQLDKWEFLIKYCYSEDGTVYKERWIQSKNPETAVFGDVDAADITRITGEDYKTGSWGGLYKKNGSAYWVINNGTNGNWWGATGSFSIYQGGIPGYGGKITTTGYNDLYVRIDNVSLNNLTSAKITANNLYMGRDFIEK